ncbi:hypothetical protein [Paenibacillus xylaniclasticus]|uniref:hypothetical protein n=1 Tax=Paenibacillus xylaniclasticus TaxID=588083 RepID=UPI000FD89199|nr:MULTISPECIES: hypothetical protein [Paenibacillus]GFN34191.1 hypothetical protein PCURB6_44510 [Paenibacillus curdlanolyticus]
MKKKYLKLSLLFVLLITFALPVHLASAAVDQKQEVVDYFEALEKISKYETKALDAYSKIIIVTSKNRKETYLLFANTIVPNYEKFVKGLKAIKAPTTPELLKLHKAGINATSQQLDGLTMMKKALYKNPMDSSAWDKANKIINKAAPLVNKWGDDLVAYYDKVVTAAEKKEAASKYLKFSLKISEEEAAEELRDEAIALLHSYAEALKSGDTSKMDNLLYTWIPKKDVLLLGADYSVEGMDDYVEATIAENDVDILNDWADAVLASTADDLEVSSTYKSDYSLSVYYDLELEGFSAFSIPTVCFSFTTNDGAYFINSIRIM